MAQDKPGYAPSAVSVLGAYAAALDQLWEVPPKLWRTVTEAAYLETLTLKRRATTVFLHAPGLVTGTGDVVPGLQVSAERLALDGGPSTPVEEVEIKSTNPVTPTAKGPTVAEVTVRLRDTAPRGSYRLEFRAADLEPQVRIVSFGV
jgi:hypothetical protein